MGSFRWGQKSCALASFRLKNLCSPQLIREVCAPREASLEFQANVFLVSSSFCEMSVIATGVYFNFQVSSSTWMTPHSNNGSSTFCDHVNKSRSSSFNSAILAWNANFFSSHSWIFFNSLSLAWRFRSISSYSACNAAVSSCSFSNLLFKVGRSTISSDVDNGEMYLVYLIW